MHPTAIRSHFGPSAYLLGMSKILKRPAQNVVLKRPAAQKLIKSYCAPLTEAVEESVLRAFNEVNEGRFDLATLKKNSLWLAEWVACVFGSHRDGCDSGFIFRDVEMSECGFHELFLQVVT